MEELKKMSPEILIYIQNIKKYMSENETTRKYFAIDNNENLFFEYLAELSEKNFLESGEPQLSLDQFELLRRRMHGESDPEHQVSRGVFVSLGDLGYISLN